MSVDTNKQIVNQCKDVDTSKAFKVFIESFESYSQEWLKTIFSDRPELSLKSRFSVSELDENGNNVVLYTAGVVHNKQGTERKKYKTPRIVSRIVKGIFQGINILFNVFIFLICLLVFERLLDEKTFSISLMKHI